MLKVGSRKERLASCEKVDAHSVRDTAVARGSTNRHTAALPPLPGLKEISSFNSFYFLKTNLKLIEVDWSVTHPRDVTNECCCKQFESMPGILYYQTGRTQLAFHTSVRENEQPSETKLLFWQKDSKRAVVYFSTCWNVPHSLLY